MRALWICLFLSLCGSVLPGHSSAAPAGLSSVCATVPVEVTGGAATDQALVCAGARRAVDFFHLHGISMTQPVRVQLHQSTLGRDAHIGLYDASDHRIDLLTLAQAKRLCREQSPFGLPMDRALYLSFVVHEIAHAVVDQNLGTVARPWATHEYVAAVAQLVSLPEDRRAAVLERHRQAPFEGVDRISRVYYDLDPAAFAVKAYRHFTAQAEPGNFLRALLVGGAAGRPR